ncbi:hypothetical protein CA54_48760 [Symmachiella macrocystis]|uniref:Sulfotransferase family protein n=1 Tax=Symmachiella macrocystis TaxID=2527985 RepID=A0A5C6BGR7_9PLAN|nr:hypothetical protein [Symmachiella macrocystis]TWU09634.1 hypothetical protein CA54_48760 [Symmachiella macrocystis]
MQKTIVVLGMHRSATSLVACGLHREISMGDDLLPASDSNPHGHFEDRHFVRLNDQILSAAGGRWDRPPSRQAIQNVAAGFSDQIQSTLELAGSGKEIWGFKDPRTTLTVPLYLPFLQNPHFVCSFRAPDQLARSLKRRNGFPLEKGLRLAAIYNRRLLEFLSEFTGLTVHESYDGP